jgi:hypothetical protein
MSVTLKLNTKIDDQEDLEKLGKLCTAIADLHEIANSDYFFEARDVLNEIDDILRDLEFMKK